MPDDESVANQDEQQVESPVEEGGEEKDEAKVAFEKLKELMGSPDLIILDLRYGVGWTLSTQKIKGALREDPKEKTAEWAGKYGKDKTIVTYCA